MAHPVKTLFFQPLEISLQKVEGRLLHLFSTHSEINPNVAKRSVKSIQVVTKTEEPPVKTGSHFIHPIPPEESPVKGRNSCLTLLHDIAVQIDTQFSRHPPHPPLTSHTPDIRDAHEETNPSKSGKIQFSFPMIWGNERKM
jgi:hypothetical protein